MTTAKDLLSQLNQAVADCITVQTDSSLLPSWAKQSTKTRSVKLKTESGDIVTVQENSNRAVSLADLLARAERRELKRANEKQERAILAESKAERLRLHGLRIQAEQEHDDEFCHDIHHGQREFAYAEFAKLIGLDADE